MTEDQIERSVERRFDRLDAQFMADGSTMTQAEYDAKCIKISQWASARLGRSATN